MAVDQDMFDAMSEDELVHYLQAVAEHRRDNLAIGERIGDLGIAEWVAEIWHVGGLAGRTVMFAGTGASRRDAMLALVRTVASAR